VEPDRSSGRGVSLSYLLKEGQVTVASLTGRGGTYRMLIAPGKSVRAQELFHGGINSFVKFRVNHRDFLQKIKGMSHHWVIGMGDVSNELVEFCQMAEVREVLV
jgi:L-arabinose isomerase